MGVWGEQLFLTSLLAAMLGTEQDVYSEYGAEVSYEDIRKLFGRMVLDPVTMRRSLTLTLDESELFRLERECVV